MRSLPASGGGELPTPRTFQAYAFEQPSSPHTQALRMSAASTNHNERVLLADIGGTNCRLSLVAEPGANPADIDNLPSQETGGTMPVEKRVMVEGADLTVTGSGDNLMVGDAKVICGGVHTANATVYLIDSVLMPPSK